MPTEIEAKIRLDDPSVAESRLCELAGPPRSDVFETNTFFDTPDGRLREADCGLRIRTVPGRVAVLTYKGPRRPGPIKVRQEVEVEIADAADMAAILDGLGFKACLSFQKRRRTWVLCDCEVVIDIIGGLGNFLEVEGLSEPTVMATLAKLGLAGEPLVRESYAQLVAALPPEQRSKTNPR